MKVLILICMIFCHIIDDYYLQGKSVLSSMKQKEWWKKNAPEDLYKYDYIVALFIYSFSWSFMTMIIPTIYYITRTSNNCNHILPVVIFFIINIIIHAVVDNAKANEKALNLIQDQIIHIIQVICIWLVMVVI